tara:strand:- start:277 stop:552 length:276 start_codon:yes stop_codon:yes gene_type:complete
MKDLNEIKLKDSETIKIIIGKDSYVEMGKLKSGTIFVDIKHHNTKAVDKVKLDKYSGFSNTDSKEVSWSKCESSLRQEEGYVTVTHTAYNK